MLRHRMISGTEIVARVKVTTAKVTTRTRNGMDPAPTASFVIDERRLPPGWWRHGREGPASTHGIRQLAFDVGYPTVSPPVPLVAAIYRAAGASIAPLVVS
ncbi:hypothetical protein FsymDg_0462 [Candidatus Protofrankia datiscae]|uniref:Uncharacterized protein n=1 Tax=Candidatus Protofrankia datiscae TaxID=2716812 RepID=F8B5F5_9ACTN|nr:hypothetical protein FsymDg_0462 [Candidatus Protofrankia datiscae]